MVLLPLNEIEDKLWHLWSRNEDRLGWRFVVFDLLPKSQSDANDEPGDFLEQYDDDSHLGKNSGVFDASDLGFGEDAEIVFCRGIGSLRSGSEGLELLMPVSAANNLRDEPRELANRHVPGEAMVVDPVGTTFRIFDDLRVV